MKIALLNEWLGIRGIALVNSTNPQPEMFWIIRNGIRLTGMLAFGKQLTDQETSN